MRKTDDRRKIKRQETKERKQKEKEEKRKDLKQLQDLKRKEIEEKIEKLKEITGNTDVAFHVRFLYFSCIEICIILNKMFTLLIYFLYIY